MMDKLFDITIATVLFLLCFGIITSFAGEKKYIIYNKKTGAIIESGQVNLERDQKEIITGDNSTITEKISKTVKENIGLNLVFVGLDFPEINKNYKINNPDFSNIEKL